MSQVPEVWAFGRSSEKCAHPLPACPALVSWAICSGGPSRLTCSYATSTDEHGVPYQTMGAGYEKENQDSPADGKLHSIEAERQDQGPPKAPSQVLPHQ
ncbi:translocator protein 2 [Prionailurus iriomotensis]